MRAVLDTNIVISGLLSAGGPSARILRLAIRRDIQPCVDQRIRDEYARVLARPRFRALPADVLEVYQAICAVALDVVAPPLRVALPHRDDLPFLEVGAAADAALVTGNTRHFPKRARGAVVVVGPGEFLDLLSRTL